MFLSYIFYHLHVVEKKFVHLKFYLQENNMSLINFQHD